jgi:hypothetical protein
MIVKDHILYSRFFTGKRCSISRNVVLHRAALRHEDPGRGEKTMKTLSGEVEESMRRLLRLIHTSLPARLSCAMVPGREEGEYHVHDLIYEEKQPTSGLGPLLESKLLSLTAGSQCSFCAGHFAMGRCGQAGGSQDASSVLLFPFAFPGEKNAVLAFTHPGEDVYRDRDLHYVRGILRRHSLYLDHVRQIPSPEEVGTREGGSSVLPLSPYYLYNMLSAFLRASLRILPIDALVLTIWAEIVPKGEFLQVVGWKSDQPMSTKPTERAETLMKRLGTSFKLDEFTFFYKKCRLRFEVEDAIPRLPASVTVPLHLLGKPVGTITLKSRCLEAKEKMARAIPDLSTLLLWEMRISRKRHELRRSARGDDLSLVSSMALQDDLATYYKSAKRFGEALSAIVFSPLDPHRVPEATLESLSRLFLLMRKSVRAVDTASRMEPLGLTVLLPKATHREASKVAERLMKLADEVLKHERYLGRNIFLKYRVVSFPEVAKDEVELWEAIAGTAYV